MSENQLNLINRERITVVRDGKEVDVFNWVNVGRHSMVRGHNPVVSHEETHIGAGDGNRDPDAVTHWVAQELKDEFQIDVSEHGIEVIDPTSKEVDVL